MKHLLMWMALLLSLCSSAQSIQPFDMPILRGGIGEKTLTLAAADSARSVTATTYWDRNGRMLPTSQQPILIRSARPGTTLVVRLDNTVNLPASGGWIEIRVSGQLRAQGRLIVSTTAPSTPGTTPTTPPTSTTTGEKGDTGATGPKGDTGLTGPKGDTGQTGATGPKGDKGDTGLTGTKGDTGVIGVTGSTGPKGDTGLPGAAGPQGSIGLTGATGPKGDIGLTGATGAKGDIGSAGPKGDAGLTGAAGSKGDTGAAGLKGDTGATGMTGPKGDTGLTGQAGLTPTFSVSVTTLPAGTTATVTQGGSSTAVTLLIGVPKGDKGDTGASGSGSSGGGDMSKTTYDTDNNGKVDDTDRFGGQTPAAYATTTAFNSHANNTNNPHSVTAAQIGAYTKGEVDSKLNSTTSAQASTDQVQSTSINAAQTRADNAYSLAQGKASSSHTHDAADIASGTIVPARLGSGTAATGKYLDGSGQWKDLSGAVSIDQWFDATMTGSPSDSVNGVGVDLTAELTRIRATFVNSLTTTTAGTALDGRAGKTLKDLIDANTAAIATKQAALSTSVSFEANSGTFQEIHLKGATSAETAAFNIVPVTGLGVRMPGGWHFTTSGSLYNQGSGIIKTDGSLTLQGATVTVQGNLTLPQLTFADGTTQTSGASVVAVPVKTWTAIQAAYNAVPNSATATIFLSGTYVQGALTTLNITSQTKTVFFKSLDRALLLANAALQKPEPDILINGQTGGGWEGIDIYSDRAYTSFNYGLVLINESAAMKGYAFVDCSMKCPKLLGNALTVLAWSEQTNTGTVHDRIRLHRSRFEGGRMGVEWVSHNWTESGQPIRITNPSITYCEFVNTGQVSKDGMGNSFSGPISNIELTHCLFDGNKQYCNEFIGTIGGTVGFNRFINTKTWGEGTNGTGTNLTVGYNFTDGGNNGLGCRGLTITNDYMVVNGRPFLCYGGSRLTFNGGDWTGGLCVDFNKGTSSGGALSSDILMNGVSWIIAGNQATYGDAGNAISIRSTARMVLTNCNITLAPTGGSAFALGNAFSSADRVLINGGSWRRPTSANDSFFNLNATNSPAIGTHLESTF